MTSKKTTKVSANLFNPNEYVPLVPDVKFLGNLFSEVNLWPDMDPGKVQVPTFKIGELDSKGYCQVCVVDSDKHFDALMIRPAMALRDAVSGHMLKIDNDQIHFEIIVRSDRTSRVYAKYGQIIGSRLIAQFDAKETRSFFRNLSKLHDYPTLPRALKSS